MTMCAVMNAIVRWYKLPPHLEMFRAEAPLPTVPSMWIDINLTALCLQASAAATVCKLQVDLFKLPMLIICVTMLWQHLVSSWVGAAVTHEISSEWDRCLRLPGKGGLFDLCLVQCNSHAMCAPGIYVAFRSSLLLGGPR